MFTKKLQQRTSILLFILIGIFLFSSFSSAVSCYQEQADGSGTRAYDGNCELNYGGQYRQYRNNVVNNVWNDKVRDGIWTTYDNQWGSSLQEPNSFKYRLESDYRLPSQSIVSATFKTKLSVKVGASHADREYVFPIDSACLNINTLRLATYRTFSLQTGSMLHFTCLTPNGWTDLDTPVAQVYQGKMYEEAVIWNTGIQTPICSTDLQCGVQRIINVCSGVRSIQTNITPVCNNPGLISSSCSNAITTTTTVCATGCSILTGVCNPAPINCTINSECGTNGFVGQSFCSGSNSTQNYRTFTCNNAGTTSSYCPNILTPRTLEVCANGCDIFSGACNSAPITCSNNLQCGTDGFLSQPTCSGDNRVQNYQTFTCSNPGNTNSYCSNTTNSIILQSCQYGCSNGACNSAPIICSNNLQCGNPTTTSTCSGNNRTQTITIPTCHNAGSINSYCLNSTSTDSIVCQYGCSNNACNLNPGNQTCANEQIKCISDNFWKCENDSWVNKFQVIGECGVDCLLNSDCDGNRVCENWICINKSIKCEGDSDCNDHNINTIDSCINAGTFESYCFNNNTHKGEYNTNFHGKAYGDNLLLNDPKFVFCGNGICESGEGSECSDCTPKIVYRTEETFVLNQEVQKKNILEEILNFFKSLFVSSSLRLCLN